MRKATAVVFFIVIIVLASTNSTPRVSTQDCLVQIISVNLNKSVFSIGEKLQVNITYNLYYDIMDPFGLGAISVSISDSGGGPPILVKEFMELGINVEKTITLDILPQDWEPSTDGQNSSIQVFGWVQDSYNSMTDQITKDFWVIRSETNLDIEPTPTSLIFHDVLNITARLANPHNYTLPLANHEICISINNSSQNIHTWNLNTSNDGYVTKLIETTALGPGNFTYNITSPPNDDYLEASYQSPFEITKANIQLNAEFNATAYQTYYPSMSNCTAIISIDASCHQILHDMSEATVVWSFDNRSDELTYQSGTLFTDEITTPIIPGVYNVSVTIALANHTTTNTCLPLIVEPRRSIFSFEANCSEAAYGDFINMSLTINDAGCYKPVVGKPVSIFVGNHSVWEFLTELLLDEKGFASFCWQAEDTGDDAFKFMALFDGEPEYIANSQTITVDNTKIIRFHIENIIEGVCGSQTDITLQITTLDYLPIPDLTVCLIELDTDSIWCTSYTNSSGYSTLSWYIHIDYEVGIHQFAVVCKDSAEILGTTSLTMIVYSSTLIHVFY